MIPLSLSLSLSSLLLLLPFLFSLSFSSAAPVKSLYPASSGVVTLTSSTFPSALSSEHLIHMVQFYSPKSGKCKQIADAYIDTAKAVGEMGVVAVVDCLNEKALCESEGVYVDEVIPVVKVYSGVAGKAASAYVSGLTTKGMTQYLFNAIPDVHIKHLTAKTHSPFSSSSSTPRVLLFTDKPSPSSLYRALSHSLYHKLSFTQIAKSESKLTRLYKVNRFPTLLVEYNEGGEEKQEKYEGEMKFGALSKWLGEIVGKSTAGGSTTAEGGEGEGGEHVALDQLVDQSCMESICLNSSSLCIIVVVSPGSPSFSASLSRLRTIQLSHYGSLFRFAWLDALSQSSFLSSSFALSPQDYPQLLLLSAKKKRWAPFVGSFTHEAITRWLDEVRSGKVRTVELESGELNRLEGEGNVCEQKRLKEEEEERKEKERKAAEEAEEAKRKQSQRSIPAKTKRVDGRLTKNDFEETVLDSPSAWLLLFTSSSSSFMNPAQMQLVTVDWNKVSAKCKSMIRFGSINIEEEEELAREFNVKKEEGVVVMYWDTEVKKEAATAKRYEGDIGALPLYEFALSLLTSKHVSELQGGEHGLFQFMAREPTALPRVVLFTSSPAPSVPPLFQSLSSFFPSSSLLFAIVRSTETELVQKFSVRSFPSLYAIGLEESKELSAEGQKQVQLVATMYGGKMNWEGLAGFCEDVLRKGVRGAGLQKDRQKDEQKEKKETKEEEERKKEKVEKKVKEEKKDGNEEEKKKKKKSVEETGSSVVSEKKKKGEEEGSCGGNGGEGEEDTGMCTAPPPSSSSPSSKDGEKESKPELKRQKPVYESEDDLPEHIEL